MNLRTVNDSGGKGDGSTAWLKTKSIHYKEGISCLPEKFVGTVGFVGQIEEMG